MGKPEFSSSEHFLPPKTLAERLKAQATGQAEIEAASFMAERFAPDLPANTSEPELDTSPEPAEETPRQDWRIHRRWGPHGPTA